MEKQMNNNKKKKNHSSLCAPRPACAPSAWVSTRKVACPAGGGGKQSAGRHQALLKGAASLGPGALLVLVLLLLFLVLLLLRGR